MSLCKNCGHPRAEHHAHPEVNSDDRLWICPTSIFEEVPPVPVVEERFVEDKPENHLTEEALDSLQGGYMTGDAEKNVRAHLASCRLCREKFLGMGGALDER